MRLYTYLLRNIPAEVKAQHRATWFVYSGPYGEKERLQSGRRYYGMGYDVTCSCGWESRTGGAIKPSVKEDHAAHIWHANAALEMHAEARAAGYDPDDEQSYHQYLLTLIKAVFEEGK